MQKILQYVFHRGTILFALVTMFLNFLGFALLIPVIPFIVEKYLPAHQANLVGVYVGLLIAVYAFCQFISAPTLGLLSDRFGRRPVLLVSLIGTIIGYLLLGIGGALWVLFLGRIIDGLTGGNISTIYAYVADISQPHQRGKLFGLLGAAGGVGFIIGPVVGGYVGAVHLFLPFFVGAGAVFLNLLWGYFVMPETLKKEHKVQEIKLSHLNPFLQFGYVLAMPSLKQLFLVGFLFFFPLTAYQAMGSTFLKDVLNLGPAGIGTILFVIGVVDIVAQGYLTHLLLPRLGEIKVTMLGLIIIVVGYAMYASAPLAPSLLLMYITVIVVVLGDGLVEPALSGLIANNAEPNMQGRVQGANQSMQSAARAVGPLYGGYLYHTGKSMPYLGNMLITSMAAIALFLSVKKIKDAKK